MERRAAGRPRPFTSLARRRTVAKPSVTDCPIGASATRTSGTPCRVTRTGPDSGTAGVGRSRAGAAGNAKPRVEGATRHAGSPDAHEPTDGEHLGGRREDPDARGFATTFRPTGRRSRRSLSVELLIGVPVSEAGCAVSTAGAGFCPVLQSQAPDHFSFGAPEENLQLRGARKTMLIAAQVRRDLVGHSHLETALSSEVVCNQQIANRRCGSSGHLKYPRGSESPSRRESTPNQGCAVTQLQVFYLLRS